MNRLSQVPRADLERELRRAAHIIGWMAPHIARMTPPDDGIANLNEHWLFCAAHHVTTKPAALGAALDQRDHEPAGVRTP